MATEVRRCNCGSGLREIYISDPQSGISFNCCTVCKAYRLAGVRTNVWESVKRTEAATEGIILGWTLRRAFRAGGWYFAYVIALCRRKGIVRTIGTTRRELKAAVKRTMPFSPVAFVGLVLAAYFHFSQPAATKLAEMPASTPTPPAPAPPTIPTSIAVGKFAGRQAIYVRGTIIPGENEDFVRSASALHNPLVVLSSPGGNLLAGIRIGEFARAHGWDTVVPDGEDCMSACALAWLGGVHRFMGKVPSIGFHAASRIDEQGKWVESGPGNALLGAYLTKLGLSQSAVLYVTTAGPDDIQLLTFSDANALGIRVAMMPR